MPARLLAALFACTAVAALSGQESVAGMRQLDRALDDLADPARARAAADTLVGLGAESVPRLAALVSAPQRYVEPRPRVLGALYVLGRLGPAAQSALPVLLTAIDDRDWGIADQAFWALGEVGQHADAAHREQLAVLIEQTHFAARVCKERLLLGREPGIEQLRGDLCADEAARVTAACLQLQPRRYGGMEVRDELRNCLRIQLEVSLRPLAAPWDESPLRPAASALAAAFWGLCGGSGARGRAVGAPPGAELLVGRGLLRHYDPTMRRLALSLVGSLGSAARMERAELLPMLADGDAENRQLAVWTFQGFGRSGLLALPQLRRLQRLDGDVGVRLACATVAEDLLRAFPAPDEAALLQAIDARLRGAVVEPLPLPRTPPGIDMLAEVLCGAEWSEATIVCRLLPEPPVGQPVPPALVAAVLRYGINVEPELRRLAAGWLARHVRASDAADLEAALAQMAVLRGGDDPDFVEMLAWVRAGAGATVDDLRAALRHGNPRVVVRAAAEWLQRGLPAGSLDRATVRQWGDAPVAAGTDADPDAGPRWWLLDNDLAPEVAAAGALLLLADGADGVDAGVLRILAPHGADATAWLQERVAARAYGALGRQLEEQVRNLLELPNDIAAR